MFLDVTVTAKKEMSRKEGWKPNFISAKLQY